MKTREVVATDTKSKAERAGLLIIEGTIANIKQK